jgi:hypothetical protein
MGPLTLATMKKQRLQAYLEPEIAEQIRQRAEDGHRPESWEVERLIRLGLKASEAAEREEVTAQ